MRQIWRAKPNIRPHYTTSLIMSHHITPYLVEWQTLKHNKVFPMDCLMWMWVPTSIWSRPRAKVTQSNEWRGKTKPQISCQNNCILIWHTFSFFRISSSLHTYIRLNRIWEWAFIMTLLHTRHLNYSWI